ncbi:hypothetical protein [Microbulbifer taiwanensis]|uniref:hypothetical protein n=1 Tax=Microbulbifer taiwanensis TaxID=986746 RepID=UPI00366DC845
MEPLIVISWVIVAVFAFTSAASCLALVGIIQLPNPKQQQRLFQVLIVQIVVISLGLFSDKMRLNEEQSEGPESSPQLLAQGAPTTAVDAVPVSNRKAVRPSEPAGDNAPTGNDQQDVQAAARTTPVEFSEIKISDTIVLKARTPGRTSLSRSITIIPAACSAPLATRRAKYSIPRNSR